MFEKKERNEKKKKKKKLLNRWQAVKTVFRRHVSDSCLLSLLWSVCLSITKTCLYNFDPLKPHLYIVKLGFTGSHIIFLISAQNIDCGCSLEPPRWGGSNEYPQSMFWAEKRGGSNEHPQSMFWAEIWKISEFFIWILLSFDGKIFSIFE